jgi:carbamoyl-phosphate synthase small subunit
MRLVLDDGTEWNGEGAGAPVAVAGEVVFNTAMSGYPESLTDPSYAGQILVLTYPLIGNYGVPADLLDASGFSTLQSRRPQIEGLVVQRLSSHYSHHGAAQSLSEWLAAYGVPIISGVDTRALTQRLRERGTMGGVLHPAGMSADEAARQVRPLDMHAEVFHRVAPAAPVLYEGGDPRVLVIDAGAKDGIVQCLRERGATVLRAPWHAPMRPLAASVDGIVIGNGPGDPSDLDALSDQVRQLFDAFDGPIFGVCLGHQILARAAGFSTYKLRYGHRGVNQPVREIGTGRCYVTSQNHGYAVDMVRHDAEWAPWFENLNDGTNEGLKSRTRPIFSVQFHPEGRPGPLDTEFLFGEFLRIASSQRTVRSA